MDNMILVSINPFAVRKLVALGATLLCLSTASCFADALFLASNGKGNVAVSDAQTLRGSSGGASESRATPAAPAPGLLPALYDLPRSAQPHWEMAEQVYGGLDTAATHV